MATNPLSVRINNYAQLQKNIATLLSKEVLVGVPEDNASRTSEGADLNNAALAYIHDNGAPEVNLPARPFMYSGINRVQDKLAQQLANTARTVLTSGQASDIDRGLTRVGIIASTSIKKIITEGIPPPLADATLVDRLRRHPGRVAEKQELARRARGEAPSITDVKPLIDTGELLHSFTFVIKRKRR